MKPVSHAIKWRQKTMKKSSFFLTTPSTIARPGSRAGVFVCTNQQCTAHISHRIAAVSISVLQSHRWTTHPEAPGWNNEQTRRTDMSKDKQRAKDSVCLKKWSWFWKWELTTSSHLKICIKINVKNLTDSVSIVRKKLEKVYLSCCKIF